MSKAKKILFGCLLGLALVAGNVMVTHAGAWEGTFWEQFDKFFKTDPVGTNTGGEPIKLVNTFVNWGLMLANIVGVGFIIHGGYKYIMAAGNQEEIKKATNAVTDAVIGIVIVWAAYLIISVVLSTINPT
ncbi:pilin [Patescibacteria group bacterium]|nr:pilin [Patescibacteria group bacterium]